jgi:hypothetical protein
VFGIALLGCSDAPPTLDATMLEAGIDPVQAADAARADAGPTSKHDARSQDEASVPLPAVDAGRAINPSSCGDSADDADGDGFRTREGDCNDCVSTINPAAFDVSGNGVDEDCSGAADEPASACELGLAIDSSSAEDAARALGLCSFPSEGSRAWGVLSARFTDASGNPGLHHPHAVGLLPDFGAAKPRAGSTLLALSTGSARAQNQPDYERGCDALDDDDCNLEFDCDEDGAEPPAGYPKPSKSCEFPAEGAGLAYDQAALELKLRVPSNANGLSFDSMFYTHEFPHYICLDYNDFFAVFKEPRERAAADANILFDDNHHPIGVDSALFAVCDPDAPTPKPFACPLGTALLKGTGFGPHERRCGLSDYFRGGGATGWLKTTAPVDPGSLITLRFAIWDTGDPYFDSTALLDHFTWTTFEGMPEKAVDIKTGHAPPLL